MILFFVSAWASPIDIFGFGARNMGMAASGTASLGMEALSLNPAGIAGERSLLFGYSLLRTDFVAVPSVAWDSNQDGTINEWDERLLVDVNYAPIDGLSLGIVQPLMENVTFGLNAYFPSAQLLRLHTYDSALPSYFLFRSSLQRYGFMGGVSIALPKGIRIGLGADLLYTARFVLTGTIRGAVSGEENAETDPQIAAVVDLHETSLEASPAGAYTLGVQWDVPFLEQVRIGGAYRTAHANPMEVKLDLQIDGTLEDLGSLNDQNLSAVAPVSLSLLDFYKPAEFRLGLAWEQFQRAQIYSDVVWTGWSQAFLNTIQVEQGALYIPMLYEDPLVVQDGNPYELRLRDTWSYRLGVSSSWKIMEREVQFRFGSSYTSSALLQYGKNITPLDAPRFTVSTGSTVHMISPIVNKPFSVSVFAQLQQFLDGMVDVAYDTPQTLGNPGVSQVPVGGRFVGFGVQTDVFY